MGARQWELRKGLPVFGWARAWGNFGSLHASKNTACTNLRTRAVLFNNWVIE